MRTCNKYLGDKLVGMEEVLTNYALSLTYNIDDAKDLVQESFYKALNNAEKFDIDTNLQAWMFTILKNTFINEYRKKSRRNTVLSKDTHEYIINNRPSHHNPESDYAAKEMEDRISSLTPEFRIPFSMHKSGYKYNEIAEKLNLKLGTVKSRIHFSKEKIKERLEY